MDNLNLSGQNLYAGSQVDAKTADYQEPLNGGAPQKQWAQQDKFSVKEIIHKVAHGENSTDISRNLLSNLVKKVADKALAIHVSPDKGRNNPSAQSELSLLFGTEVSSKDNVTLSAQAQMSKLEDKTFKKKERSLFSSDNSYVDEEQEESKDSKIFSGLGSEESFAAQIFKENDEIKAKLKQQSDVQNKQIEDTTQQDSDSDAVENSTEEQIGEKESFDDEVERTNKEDKSVDNKEDAGGDDGQSGDSDLDETEDVEDTFGEEEDISVDGQGKKKTRVSSRGGEEFSSDTGREQKEETIAQNKAIQQYMDKYEKVIRNGNFQTNEINQLEEKLIKEGVLTTKQIKDIQLVMKKAIREDISQKILEGVIHRQLVKGERFDYLQAEASLNTLVDQIEGFSTLGGKDFGNFKDGLDGAVGEAMYRAGRDLNAFALDSMQEKLTQANVSKDPEAGKNFVKHLAKMEEITNDSGVMREWYTEHLEKIEEHQGFKPITVEREKIEETGKQVNFQAGFVGNGSSDNQGKNQQTPQEYEYTKDDERSILINRLRALYMQRALNPGIRTVLKTDFKIRKLKNGLMRLGVYTDILNEQIDKEAKEVAAEKTLEMLKEALLERASLYSLQGFTYKTIEEKIKGIIKNATTFGFQINATLFNKLRDEANRKIFETTKKELLVLEARMADADIPELVVKYREMTKLLNRLKEESKIEEDYQSNKFLESITIVEEA